MLRGGRHTGPGRCMPMIDQLQQIYRECTTWWSFVRYDACSRTSAWSPRYHLRDEQKRGRSSILCLGAWSSRRLLEDGVDLPWCSPSWHDYSVILVKGFAECIFAFTKYLWYLAYNSFLIVWPSLVLALFAWFTCCLATAWPSLMQNLSFTVSTRVVVTRKIYMLDNLGSVSVHPFPKLRRELCEMRFMLKPEFGPHDAYHLGYLRRMYYSVCLHFIW